MEEVFVLARRAGSGGPDVGGRLSLPSLCEALQEAAARHATALGVGGDALRAQGLAWVLLQWSVDAAAWPAAGEEFGVETWPSAFTDRIVKRDFFVRSGAGDLLSRATSHWAVIDLGRRRPVRMPEAVRAIPTPHRPGALDAPLLKLPAPEPPLTVLTWRVGPEHLDANGHVNNVRYVEWIAASLPGGGPPADEPVRLDVSFRAEARAGESVTVERGAEPGAPARAAFRHRVVTVEGRELALARTINK